VGQLRRVVEGVAGDHEMCSSAIDLHHLVAGRVPGEVPKSDVLIEGTVALHEVEPAR